MTEREKEMKHFGHEHRLIFNESDEINPLSCNACGLRMLSSPCYKCTIQGCSFYLHQPCTRLPHKLTHSSRYCTHDVSLLAKPHREDCRCSKCGELCKNFTYRCDRCDRFNLDPLCGHPLDIQIKHISHKQHPMVAICKESLLLCDLCGRVHKGFFFHCHQCNYWIHQDCISLPSFLRVGPHRHLLSLLYSHALQAIYPYMPDCVICEKETSLLFGAYVCMPSSSIVAHVGCAVSAMEDPGKIYHLPPLDDAFQSWIMCAVQNTTPKSDCERMLEKYHPSTHSLTTNINETAANEYSVCNACIRHIEPPYYSCTQSACDFLLHKFCADLPQIINDVFDCSRHLVSPRYDELFSLFFCQLCSRLGNGFGYSYGRDSIFHLECALAPEVIKHDSHKQHPLALGYDEWFQVIRSCCGKRNPVYSDFYSCTQCRFSVHIRCALLPKTVTHKFDKHPLTLITHSDLGDDHFCEFCEQDINPSYWFYRCIQCDHFFHVKCIPSTGKYSRIKFGGTMILPACHGDHPLSLVRMLGEYSQTCGFCRKTIQGFKDGMALQCAGCDFWIHFRCGRKSSGATVSRPYGDVFNYSYYGGRFGL
ncbi:uncharacterized protein [Henckelia pumila]|uniref:uncharacterized protein n=1 Tax=Henckelia pumila TaxID=405737 RepID=UPI003C6E59E1